MWRHKKTAIYKSRKKVSEETILLRLWSQASSLPNCEEMIFCPLSHQICGTCRDCPKIYLCVCVCECTSKTNANSLLNIYKYIPFLVVMLDVQNKWDANFAYDNPFPTVYLRATMEFWRYIFLNNPCIVSKLLFNKVFWNFISGTTILFMNSVGQEFGQGTNGLVCLFYNIRDLRYKEWNCCRAFWKMTTRIIKALQTHFQEVFFPYIAEF